MQPRIYLFSLFFSVVSALGGRGSKVALSLLAARTSDLHPLHGTDPVTLWCAPDNPQVVIRSAHFVRSSDNVKFDGTLTSNKKNATYVIESPSIKDAGQYVCELDTPHGKIKHNVYIYVRPVALINVEHFTVKDDNEFHLEGPGTSVQKGEEVNITCPVTGYPLPVVKWTKNGAPLELSSNVQLEGSTIRISAADYVDGGLYSCEANNEYSANQKTSRLLLVIDKMLNVKSETAWLLPLAVIIVMLLLLGIIIVTCEFRKRKQTKTARYTAQE